MSAVIGDAALSYSEGTSGTAEPGGLFEEDDILFCFSIWYV